jgi:hypothetical protein
MGGRESRRQVLVTVVADTSPLIALVQVDQLSLLEKLFGEILVPPAVVREVGPSLPGSSASANSHSPFPPRSCVLVSILARAKP